jgi:Tfp pilus assembly protein PilF
MKTWVARIGAALALAVTFGASIPATAYAGSSGTTTTTQFLGTHFGPMTQKQFRNAEKVINHKFEAAVHAAQAQLIAALIAAHNPGARSTARAQFRLAVISASSDRDAALVQLGTPPTGTHGYNGANNGA